MSMTDICKETKNYWLKDYVNPDRYIHTGEYTINGDTITDISFLKANQYFRIKGSDLNDGVYQNNAESLASLQDEVFDGAIWAMSVPPDFVALCDDIAAWRDKYEGVNSKNMSPFTSESISGVYSYTKSAGSASSGGNGVTWQGQFASRLNAYRRIKEI